MSGDKKTNSFLSSKLTGLFVSVAAMVLTGGDLSAQEKKPAAGGATTEVAQDVILSRRAFTEGERDIFTRLLGDKLDTSKLTLVLHSEEHDIYLSRRQGNEIHVYGRKQWDADYSKTNTDKMLIMMRPVIGTYVDAQGFESNPEKRGRKYNIRPREGFTDLSSEGQVSAIIDYYFRNLHAVKPGFKYAELSSSGLDVRLREVAEAMLPESTRALRLSLSGKKGPANSVGAQTPR